MRRTVYLSLLLAVTACDPAEGQMMDMRPPDVIDVPPSEGPIDAPLFVDQNPDPAIIEVSLEARPASVAYLSGAGATGVYSYNGTVPGPRLEGRVGDTVIVRFRNSLPEPTTIHWHGMRVPADMDGVLANDGLVPPDGTFEFRFELLDQGTFWYHPHFRSDFQVEAGLYGAIVVRGASEPDAPVEHLLVLDDVLVNPDGSLPESGMGALMVGRQGNLLLVNGRARPYLDVRAGERQRWRLVNAANARYFRLSLPGHGFAIVGVDGGLLAAAREVDEILLAPGERADVLVTPSGAPGDEIDLVTLPYDRGHGTGALPAANVARVRFSADAALDPGPLPDPAGVIADLGAPARTRVFRLQEEEMSEMHDMEPVFMINGEAFPDVTQLQARLGEIERWDVVNETAMDHPFHLHGFRFQVEARGGVAEPYRAWKDTVNVRPNETVQLAVTLDGHPGLWMYHCHILEHAERGMMGEMSVSP